VSWGDHRQFQLTNFTPRPAIRGSALMINLQTRSVAATSAYELEAGGKNLSRFQNLPHNPSHLAC
jgi:hypothetical protein